ncbi:MAG: ferrous iron transport protein B [Planctomycetota bacterium]
MTGPTRTRDAEGAATETQEAARSDWIALIGNPNTGKTTLFNALTGGRARTGNYPGVTVDKKVGTLKHPDGPDAPPVRLLDLPGTYSLAARSPDEMVAVDVLLGRRADTPRPSGVVVVVDASNLERNLYLVTQVMETGIPTVVALNMVDTARARGIAIDPEALGARLGIPVVPTVASKAEGVDALKRALIAMLDAHPPEAPWQWPEALQAAEARLAGTLESLEISGVHPVERRRALLDEGGEAERRLIERGGPRLRQALDEARSQVAANGSSAIGLEAQVRYGFIGRTVADCMERPASPPVTFSDRLDAVLTHRLLGTLILVVVMTAVFLSIFSWAAPLMDFIDGTVFGGLAEAADGWALLGDGALKSLVVDGIIAGVGSVLVFLPQILILFLFIAILEGCGYMARAAFLMDRLLRGCGLSGRSFIPMLSSFACAIPGIMATRTIESRRDRIATILVAPLMSCSARIPVYVILIAAFVPAATVFGFMNLQGIVFTGMYFVGILVAIPMAFLLKRTLLKGDTPSFLVELPPYRMPRPSVVVRRVLDQGKAFVRRAGTLIFAASILVWALSYWPRHPDPGAEAAAALRAFEEAEAIAVEFEEVERARQEQAVAAAEAAGPPLAGPAREAFAAFESDLAAKREARAAEREALAGDAENAPAGDQLRESFLGRMGRGIEPVFEPIGWDWKVSAAVVASFPAREVVVSTLGVIYNMGPDTDEETAGLQERLRAATWDAGERKGQPVFDLAGALALMVFFALCAQCASTLVIIKRETGGWKWPAFTFVYMTAFAYVGALITAVVLRAVL